MFNFGQVKSTKEILIDGIWTHYESRCEDTEKSREFYQKCGEVPFIQGSFASRINGMVQDIPTPNLVFYRKA
jgi:hypothetical protein